MIYVVSVYGYDESQVLCSFSTREGAEAYVLKCIEDLKTQIGEASSLPTRETREERYRFYDQLEAYSWIHPHSMLAILGHSLMVYNGIVIEEIPLDEIPLHKHHASHTYDFEQHGISEVLPDV